MSLGNLIFDLVPGGVSGSGNPPTETRRYVCAGTTSKSQVEALALSGTPAIVSTQYGILYRQDIKVQGNGHNNWRVDVPYGTQENATGSLNFSFDTTGGTARITAGKEHIARYNSNGVMGGTNNHGSSIEVRDGEARGTDIVVPALKLTVDFRHPAGVVGFAYAKHLSNITGTYNEDTFLTFAPGELLFAGATGKSGQQAETTLAYSFIGSANEANATIGDIINIVSKGHDHIWVEFEENDTDGKPGTKPSVAYVNRIYDSISFSENLGGWG